VTDHLTTLLPGTPLRLSVLHVTTGRPHSRRTRVRLCFTSIHWGISWSLGVPEARNVIARLPAWLAYGGDAPFLPPPRPGSSLVREAHASGARYFVETVGDIGGIARVGIWPGIIPPGVQAAGKRGGAAIAEEMRRAAAAMWVKLLPEVFFFFCTFYFVCDSHLL
jgi:hypothetical protein